MAVNFKDIRQHFFLDYLKYWIAFFIVLLLYCLNIARRHLYSTSNITLNIENAIYAANGVAINRKYVLTSKSLIDKYCVGSLSGLRSNIYVIDSSNLYRAFVVKSDSISNLMLLELKNFEDNLMNYAIIQIDQPVYKKDSKLIMPKVINSPASFSFQDARVVESRASDFFIISKNVINRENALGMPIFNKNYVLQGVVKEMNSNYEGRTSSDRILENANIQTTYSVNNTTTLKRFLDSQNIEYSVINGNINLNNERYNPKKSVVNIICIKSY